jgi:ERCC4-type nuclease
VLIAPTEPVALKALGKVSSAPEKHGVDVMFGTRQGAVGVQRKELTDFFASVADGRLAREYPLMQQLAIGVLLIEGRQRWSTEGYLLNLNDFARQQWSRDQFRAYMLSVQARGIWVVETDDLADTVKWLKNFERWALKPNHNSLILRPKPQGAWGKPESRDWNLHLAQSFQGVGPTQAERIIDHFGGVLPLAWTCSKEELGKVTGIGKMRLDQLWAALPPNPNVIEVEAKPKPRKKAAKKEPTS